MQALVDYLEENKPDATIAVLRADDDFGASYSETLQSLIEGTDLTIADEQTYDPETGEVAVAGDEPRRDATPTCSCSARRCSRARQALNELGTTGWKPIIVHVGHVHVEDADEPRRRERRRRAQRRRR